MVINNKNRIEGDINKIMVISLLQCRCEVVVLIQPILLPSLVRTQAVRCSLFCFFPFSFACWQVLAAYADTEKALVTLRVQMAKLSQHHAPEKNVDVYWHFGIQAPLRSTRVSRDLTEQVQRCFTETIKLIRDGEPRTATSTFTQPVGPDLMKKWALSLHQSTIQAWRGEQQLFDLFLGRALNNKVWSNDVPHDLTKNRVLRASMQLTQAWRMELWPYLLLLLLLFGGGGVMFLKTWGFRLEVF